MSLLEPLNEPLINLQNELQVIDQADILLSESRLGQLPVGFLYVGLVAAGHSP